MKSHSASKEFADVSITFGYLPKHLNNINLLAIVNEPQSCTVLYCTVQKLPNTQKLEMFVEIGLQAHGKSQTTVLNFTAAFI